MKILFLARRYIPDIGGVEKHIAKISHELLKKKYSVTVIAEVSKNDSPFAQKGSCTIINGVHVYKLQTGKNNWFKKFRIWFELWKIRKLIQEADIIHCHDVFFWYLPFKFFYWTKPVYTTFHGYEKYPISSKEIIVRKIAELFSNGNICIGAFITKWYKTKPTLISYGAVDLPNENEKKIPPPSAIYIGRLDRYTGIENYVKTLQLLRKKIKSFRALLVGEGSYENKIPKSISRIGFMQTPQTKLNEYRYVFASGYLSILEAFCAKRLVFAIYDNPLKKDYFEMAEFYPFIRVVNSPNNLVKEINYYMQNPDKEKLLIDEAYAWVKKQTWKKLTEDYITLWKLHNK